MTRNGLLLFAVVAIGVIFAGLMVRLPPGAFFSGEEGIQWLQTDSLWRHRWTSLAIDPPGGALDPDAEFIPAGLVPDRGKARSILPAMLPWLASVPYAVAGTRGIYLVPAAAALLCMAASARLARWVVPPAWTAVAGAAAVVTSPLVFYGATIGEETLAAALCAGAMIPLASGRPLPGVVSGLLLGAACFARAECLLLIPAVVVAGALAWGPRRFAASAAGLVCGAAVVLAPRAIYHQAVFGSWLGPHPDRAARSIAVDLAGPAALRPWLLASLVAGGLLLLICRVWRASSTSARGSFVWPAAGAMLSLALLALGPLRTLVLELLPLPLSTLERGYHSLLPTLPILALLPLALFLPPAPRSPHASFLGWTAALFIGLTFALAPAAADPQWGPRQLLVVAPLITLAVISWMVVRGGPAGSAACRLARGGLVLALSLGLLVQGVGLRFMVAVRTHNAGMIGKVKTAVPAGDAILSDLFAVPQLLATLSATRSILYVRPEADREALLGRLDAAGVGPSWIVDEPPAGADVMDLGAGLALVRVEQDAGVRGYLRPPRGD